MRSSLNYSRLKTRTMWKNKFAFWIVSDSLGYISQMKLCHTTGGLVAPVRKIILFA